jgi:multiple sugar transport system substrate-binding protein
LNARNRVREEQGGSDVSGRTHPSRRDFLKIGGLASLTLAGTALLAACGGSAGGPSTAATLPAAAPTTASAPAVASPTGPSNATAATPTTAAAASATGATATPAAANAASAAGGKLTFTSSTLGNMQKMYPPILDKFRAANPGVQVEDVYAAASVPDYQTKLLLMLSSGNPPDIYWVHSYMTGGLNALNVPQDLTTYIKGDSSFNLDNYFASAVKEFQAGGKQNALPRETTSTILLYNKAIFQQAGVDLPKDGWKWADHDATAAKLTSGQGPAKIYGSAGWIQVAYIYYSLIRVWQEGGDVVDSDRAKYTLDQDPGVKVYTWIADMVAKGVHPASAQGTAGDPSQLFNTGKVAMIPSFSSFSFFDNAKFEWDIQHLPTDGKRVTRNASAGHAMTAVSKAKDNAWKLLSFLEGPAAMQDYFAAGLTVTYKTVAEQALKQRQGKPPANLPIVFDALGYARPEPVVGDWLGIHKTISTALEGVYGPEHKAVKDTLSGVADKVNPLIQSKPTAG